MAGGQERELRTRIRSIQSTQKITRAFELIAASRIVRAQQAINAARPYVTQIRQVVKDVAAAPEARRHPLFRTPDSVRRAGIIVIAGDRGLSGAYNANVLRAAERLVREHTAGGAEVDLVVSGRKAVGYFRYRHRNVAASVIGSSDRPTFEDARTLVAAVMEPYERGELDRIDIVYTRFVSVGSQQVVTRQLVPLTGEATGEGEARANTVVFEYEPEPDEIINRLLPAWLEAEVLAALLESAASEHANRQRAMKAATDNAEELIKTYVRAVNRARQDAITTEIMEIVGGSEALRQVAGTSHSTARTVDSDAATAQPI
ncbi:MAG TPA: F0F1 ATP synthase subunit gamma [Acidimicrobiales bacterium]|nr:F0F1 ATP synthase subunit gamma [Acidimicrobiales bacterium]